MPVPHSSSAVPEYWVDFGFDRLGLLTLAEVPRGQTHQLRDGDTVNVRVLWVQEREPEEHDAATPAFLLGRPRPGTAFRAPREGVGRPMGLRAGMPSEPGMLNAGAFLRDFDPELSRQREEPDDHLEGHVQALGAV